MNSDLITLPATGLSLSLRVGDWLWVISWMLAGYLLASVITWLVIRPGRKQRMHGFETWLPLVRSAVWVMSLALSVTQVLTVSGDGWWWILAAGLVLVLVGLTDSLKNIMAGIWINVSRMIRRGDRITIGTHTGEVIVTGLVFLTLRDDHQRLLRIPNRECFAQPVVQEPSWMSNRVLMTVRLPAGEPDQPETFLLECVLSSPWCSLSHRPLITRLADSPEGFRLFRIEAHCVSAADTAALESDIRYWVDAGIRTRQTA